MAERIPARLSPREGRKFALTVGGAFLVFGAIALWRGHPQTAMVLGTLGGGLGLAGLIVPGKMGPVHKAWMGLAHAISRVTTPIVMGAMYFIVLTPAGLIRRTFGHNPMVATPVNGSVWVAREPGQHSDMERQF